MRVKCQLGIVTADKNDKAGIVKVRFSYKSRIPGLVTEKTYFMTCDGPIVGNTACGEEAIELIETCLEIS